MSVLEKAIKDCTTYDLAFCKFISANDAGATGAHQSGFYIPKNSWTILFDSVGIKGSNKEKLVKIRWQDDFETDSRFIYYGQGTRNEYRITRFGRGFPYLNQNHVGDLFVLIKVSDEYYRGYILETDEDIEHFLAAFGISSNQTNDLINTSLGRSETLPTLEELFKQYIAGLTVDFPETAQISAKAREFYQTINPRLIVSPDNLILNWLNTEFSLFKAIELDRYEKRISTPFASVDELVECANTLLNRRKSRAGKSLEHHLSEMFKINMLNFESQVITEDNKKPDFIFPGGEQYHNKVFNKENLFFLGAKTTCKDRWRQILNEADRIEYKHLFTLQQGISENQLVEMYKHKVVLVVPSLYIRSFPASFRDKILSLENFILRVKNKQ
ncbi:restriction endonuclease [Paenibacillus nanensis]|uniref:Restriction endonuclease n=1 Tax=Paenibacillus nanensis TaxID=393251 RepID=A0A3A1VNJ9_9BACL|nr:type II restriction endonuclease [Paenibacillus nanensis]RIX60103.1 restriction endonuclease [Paenibacillus nanensis]